MTSLAISDVITSKKKTDPELQEYQTILRKALVLGRSTYQVMVDQDTFFDLHSRFEELEEVLTQRYPFGIPAN